LTARAALGPGDLLSVDEVLAVLPVRGPGARAWFEASVVSTCEVVGVRLYRWEDVMRAMEGVVDEADDGRTAARWISLTDAARRLHVAARELRELAAQAPGDLPGAPMVTGRGAQRSHLRFDPERLAAWWSAAGAWRAAQGAAGRAIQVRPRESNCHKPDGADGSVVDWSGVVRGCNADAERERARRARGRR
jgi:hypothetical protein